MDVKAIFSDEYDGVLSGAVWIKDTAQNRLHFEKATNLDPNSALFSTEEGVSLEARLRQIVWSIQDHHPEMTSISVIGLDHALAQAVEEDCNVDFVGTGFVCRFTKLS